MTKHQVFLGLGSNLGNRETNIRQAIVLLDRHVGPVLRQSSLLETEPWGFESDYQFLNAVVLCETGKSPREVLAITQQIERALGRRNKSSDGKTSAPEYHDRPIDIDILLYDDIHLDEPDLKIPHPLMYEREFVMKPLQEITNLL